MVFRGAHTLSEAASGLPSELSECLSECLSEEGKESPMQTRYDYRCPACGGIQEVKAYLSDDLPSPTCSQCGNTMIRYFGATSSRDIAINYGFRPHRYDTLVDRDIAQYQFEHL